MDDIGDEIESSFDPDGNGEIDKKTSEILFFMFVKNVAIDSHKQQQRKR